MLKKEEVLLIVYFILVLLLLVGFVVLFFYVYQKRKNQLLLQNWKAQKTYDEEIVKSRLEIREQTLKNVGRELHDNIGQLLSVANLEINMLLPKLAVEAQEPLKEIQGILSNSLQEVRSLSKSLNHEVLEYLGLEKSLENDLLRLERLHALEVKFKISGEKVEIDSKDSIIIFRIIQEFLANSIKHAQASQLQLEIKYQEKFLEIGVWDNGKGFQLEEINKSSGLINMESRAKLLAADFQLNSKPLEGTQLLLKCPLNRKAYG